MLVLAPEFAINNDEFNIADAMSLLDSFIPACREPYAVRIIAREKNGNVLNAWEGCTKMDWEDWNVDDFGYEPSLVLEQGGSWETHAASGERMLVFG